MRLGTVFMLVRVVASSGRIVCMHHTCLPLEHATWWQALPAAGPAPAPPLPPLCSPSADMLHPPNCPAPCFMPPLHPYMPAAAGDGFGTRAEEAMLHGCIPVIIMDNVHAVFESILDWDSFSLRVPENMTEHLPLALQLVPPDRLARMQRNLQLVWHRWGAGLYCRTDGCPATLLSCHTAQSRPERTRLSWPVASWQLPPSCLPPCTVSAGTCTTYA